MVKLTVLLRKFMFSYYSRYPKERETKQTLFVVNLPERKWLERDLKECSLTQGMLMVLNHGACKVFCVPTCRPQRELSALKGQYIKIFA